MLGRGTVLPGVDHGRVTGASAYYVHAWVEDGDIVKLCEVVETDGAAVHLVSVVDRFHFEDCER